MDNGKSTSAKQPTRTPWGLVFGLLALLPLAFIAGAVSRPLLPPFLAELIPVGGWNRISFNSCVGYPVLTTVSLPDVTGCSGRFRLLDHETRSVGFVIDIAVSAADPKDIPEAWRQDRSFGGGRWKMLGTTEIGFGGEFEFTFLDEFGFVVAERTSSEVRISSGQGNHFQGVLPALSENEAKVVRSAEAILSLTHCELCEPPPN
jgi:hypothetical protein